MVLKLTLWFIIAIITRFAMAYFGSKNYYEALVFSIGVLNMYVLSIFAWKDFKKEINKGE